MNRIDNYIKISIVPIILFLLFSFINIKAAVSIYTNGTVNLYSGNLVTSGNWSNEGNFNSENNSTIEFIGSNDISLSDNLEFANLEINKNSGNINLNNDLFITNNINFVNGNIVTNSQKVNLTSSTTISGESNNGYIVGNVKITKAVGTGSSDFGGIGVNINGGTDNLGSVEVMRTSGTSGNVVINGKVGINRKWKITPSTQPVNGRNLTFSWVSNDDNTANLNFAKVWNSTNQANWNTVGNMQNASTHTITAPVTALSYFTINSAATINLPDDFTFTEDGEVTVNLEPYIEDSGAKKGNYNLYLKASQVSRLVKKSPVKNNKSYTLSISENSNISASINGDMVTFSSTTEDWNGTETVKFTLTENKDDYSLRTKNQKSSYFDYVNIIATAVNDSMEVASYFPVENTFALEGIPTQKFSLEVEDIDNSYEELEFQWFVNNENQAVNDSVFTADIYDDGIYIIKGLVTDGEFTEEIIWEVTQSNSISDLILPKRTKLSNNYPNPFNPQTKMDYQLKSLSNVSIVIYNYKGEKVRTLINSMKKPGFYSATWNGKNDFGRTLSSGVYFYMMKTADYQKIKRAIMVK